VPEYTFTKKSIGNYKEKGSTFHALAQSTSSVIDVKSQLLNIKEEYPDASHICYAYRIMIGQRLDEYSSDAGEPKGSAGQPILNTLKGQNLINAAIIVIRYFGGTKLGIPGLIHAYKTAAEDAIKNAILKPWLEKKRLIITYPYGFEGLMKSILQKNQIEVMHIDFGEKIDIQIDISVELADKFIDGINELSAGSAQIMIEN